MSYDDLYYFPFWTALASVRFSWHLWIAFSESPWLHSALLLPASVWLLPQLLEHCRIPQLLPKHQTLAACPGAGEWINPVGLPENFSSSFMSKFWNIHLYFYNKYRYSYTAVINFIECERSFLSWFRNMNRYFSFYTSIRWIYMNPCHLYFHLYMYLHKWTHSPVINDLYIYIKPCDLITLVSDMCAWPEAPDGNGLSVADASLSAGLCPLPLHQGKLVQVE